MILEACGLGDLVLSCTVGRGQKLASDWVKEKGAMSWEELEKDTMGGMRIPDWRNLTEAHNLLVSREPLARCTPRRTGLASGRRSGRSCPPRSSTHRMTSSPISSSLGYQQLAELIQDGTPGASVAVQQRLNACPGSLTSQAVRDNWEMSITTYPGLIMQYNNTYHLSTLPTSRPLSRRPLTPLDAAFAVTDFLNVTKSAEGHWFPDTRKKQADPCCASQVRGDHCRALVCGLSCAYGPVTLETSGTEVGVW